MKTKLTKTSPITCAHFFSPIRYNVFCRLLPRIAPPYLGTLRRWTVHQVQKPAAKFAYDDDGSGHFPSAKRMGEVHAVSMECRKRTCQGYCSGYPSIPSSTQRKGRCAGRPPGGRIWHISYLGRQSAVAHSLHHGSQISAPANGLPQSRDCHLPVKRICPKRRPPLPATSATASPVATLPAPHPPAHIRRRVPSPPL